MADIKTRDVVKGSIKTIDKAAVAGERMKQAYISTKDRAEHSTYAAENSADEYVAKCKEKALYDTGVSAEYGDKLITLSTCEYSNTNGRLVLVAKRVVD